ncbi:MAG TPA: hypothetical protein VHG92_10820 [Afifellaceae bacterium]|nr:hypothetical protein [Afifellaceae bacterium]
MRRLLLRSLAAILIALSAVTLPACDAPEQSEEAENGEEEDD